MPEITEEKNESNPGSQDAQVYAAPGPFGLHEEDRPMLPGKDKIPSQNNKGGKTTGEKFYDRFQFATGQAVILFLTAVMAYSAQYGKDKYTFKFGNKQVQIPNVLRGFQKWLNSILQNNKIFPMKKRGKDDIAGEKLERIAGAFSNMMALSLGGTSFAPVMRTLENNREKIATYVNKRWGKPGEVESGRERLKDVPKESWWDVIKGRISAMALVFASFMTFDAIFGKDKETSVYRFDKYEQWFGRKVAGLIKSGKDISKIPMTQPLTVAQDANSTYRFSKILALDLYATTVSIMLWNFISRLSARMRKEHAEQKNHTSPNSNVTPAKNTDGDEDSPAQKKSFAAREGGKPKDLYAHAAGSSATSGQAV